MNDTFILIKSCWANKARRDAIRETWLPRIDWADFAFVLGSHVPARPYGDRCQNLFDEPDMRIYAEPDDFRQIGPKILQCFQEIVGKYERIVVLDDDVYVVPARLRSLVETVRAGDYVGFLREDAGAWGPVKYMQGSAYVLGSAALYLLATSCGLWRRMPDDVAVGEILRDAVNLRHEPRFHPGPLFGELPFQGGLITNHKVDPTSMRWMHDQVLEAERQYNAV